MGTVAGMQRRRALAEAGDPAVPHGYNGYRNWGCRCKICRDANAAAMAARIAQPLRHDKHGTMLNYRRGCRCEACAGVQHAEYLKGRAQKNAREVQRNAESRRLPWRTARRWSAEDTELCARGDLTVGQVAALTGRSVGAVEGLRRRLRARQVG